MLENNQTSSRSVNFYVRCRHTLLILLGFVCFGACGGESPAEDVQVSSDLGIVEELPAQLDATTDLGVTIPDTTGDTSPGDTVEDVPAPVEDDGSTPDSVVAPDGEPAQDTQESATFSTACVTTPDCNLPCASGLCVEGQCNFTPKPGICLVDAGDSMVQCVDAGEASSDISCLVCNPEHNGLGWSAALFSTGFEPTNTMSLDLTDASFSGVKWHLSTRRSYSGAYSLYAGDEESATYGVNAHVRTEATTPVLTLPEGNPWLGFVVWMETEETPGYDHLLVEVLHHNSLEVLATPLNSDVIHSTTQGRWLPMSVDLTDFAGQEVRLRFAFDTKDAKINGFEGVYLDEVRLWTGCCGSDIDCDFSNPCKVGSCESPGSACTVETVETCCLLDSGCDDDNACTLDTCPEFGGSCSNDLIEGCCLSDLECDDSNDCTEDRCTAVGGVCEYTQLCCENNDDCVSPNPCLVGTCSEQTCSFEDICCQSGADCNDNDPCTYDICQDDGSCAHTFKALAGCCSPEPYSSELEDGEHGFTFEGSCSPQPCNNSVGWHWVTGQQAVSGSGALYYGNPSNMNYNSGSYSENLGTATGPSVFLTSGVDASFSAMVWMHTESSSYYDKLFIYLEYEKEDLSWGEALLWKKVSGFSQETWNTISVPVHAFAGMNVRVRFEFDTVDGTVNNTEGVYVDDIKFVSSCSDVECNTASDCNDGIASTVEVCDNGSCIYVLNDSSNATFCSTNSECSDGDFCTIDTCDNGVCVYTDSPFCF